MNTKDDAARKQNSPPVVADDSSAMAQKLPLLRICLAVRASTAG